MRRQRRPHRNVQIQAQQFDLFGPPRAFSGKPAPVWNMLPEETRQTVAQLMAQLLTEHAAARCQPRPAGGRHDV
jgi:hypothetical protein